MELADHLFGIGDVVKRLIFGLAQQERVDVAAGGPHQGDMKKLVDLAQEMPHGAILSRRVATCSG